MAHQNTGNSEHIGGGIVATFDGFGYEIRSPDQPDDSHGVYLDPFALDKLLEFVRNCSGETLTTKGGSDDNNGHGMDMGNQRPV